MNIKKQNETICWDCQNCTKCTWSRGVPVCGWEATPTKIAFGDKVIDSYCVLKCPFFKKTNTNRVTLNYLAKITGIPIRSICRYIYNDNAEKLEELKKILKKKKYYLVIDDDLESTRKHYFLKKL